MKKLAVFKLASCDGCQLSLLDCENELLDLVGAVEIAHFLEASRQVSPGPYDLTLVEGSVSTPEEERRIVEIRAESRFLVAIGACATAGGIQALRAYAQVDEWKRQVYPQPEYIEALAGCHPIAAYVKVDFELRGCPIDKQQLLEVICAFLLGRRPNVPRHSVCVECKLEGHNCLPVSRGVACLGPITQAGCGAICPGFGRGCYGCFGPAPGAPVENLPRVLGLSGQTGGQIVRSLRTYNTAAPEFFRVSGGCADTDHQR